MKKVFIVIILMVGIAGCVEQEKKPSKPADLFSYSVHPFSVRDMLAMDRLSEPVLSGDAQTIAFTVRVTDLEADRGRTDIFLIDVNGLSTKQLTNHPETDSSPRFSPDGKFIYFLSDRSGTFQLWQMKTDGSAQKQITKLPLDIANLIISPDGKKAAFTVEVFPGLSMEETKQKLDEQSKKKASGKIYDSIFVRHWDSWADGRRSHLFVMDLESKEPVDVMKNMDADTPSKPFGSAEEFTFTPDSSGVVFSARDVGKSEAWSTDFDLYYAPVTASAEPVCLTGENPAWDTNPLFSPDGTKMAYLAMKRPGCEADKFDIVIYDWLTGRKKVLTENFDRSPSAISFSRDGQFIYAAAGNLGQTSLFKIDTTTGEAKTIVYKGNVSSPMDTGGKIIFTMDNFSAPAELYSVSPDGTNMKLLTQINVPRLPYILTGEYEQFSFKGWNDETVYGFVVKPVEFDESKRYPVILMIHGGPQGSFSNCFHYRWNPQAFAGAGYAVVMIDFHGSTGYGQAFCDSIRDDWGGKPLEDLQKGLDATLTHYRWMDRNQIAAMGGSYGGYMVNWIAGNWPDRFKCLVNHCGIISERMSYFDTEELWFPEWDHIGTPWDNPDSYEKHNPVNFVKNWQTPMLVITGQNDYRVPYTQSLGTFNALQRKGIESRLLFFPDENHWVLKPNNSILWHETIIQWFDKYLK